MSVVAMENFWGMTQVIAIGVLMGYAIIFVLFAAFIITLIRILFIKDGL